jgi:hypothetical protein
MRKEIVRHSKTVPGIKYITTSIGALRYLEVTYKDKYLYKSHAPQKVSKVIAASENMLKDPNIVWSFNAAFLNVASEKDNENYAFFRTGLTHPEFEA